MSRNISVRVGIATVLSIVLAGSIKSFAAIATTNYTRSSAPDVFITEIQTSSIASAGEEFIELYNNGDNDIDLADGTHAGKDSWKLQYFSGSKLSGLLPTQNWSGPTRTINLTGTVPAHDYYILAASGYNPGSITPDQNYSATLADDAGALQLVDTASSGTVTNVGIHDQVAWSNDKTLLASTLLNAPAGPGASLQRVPNDDSQYVNDDLSLVPFSADSRLSPLNAWTPQLPTVPTGPTDDGDDGSGQGGNDTNQPAPDNTGLPTPIITELLPNPAAPQSDEADEFIELYNPGNSDFELNGYTIETGQSTLHDFTFTSDVILPAQSYLALYSAQTSLSLSNSGGQARLLDPHGLLLDQTDSYTTAADGQAWALDLNDGIWHWTTTPTPNTANLISLPAAKVSVIKTAAKKTSTAKIKGASTTKKAKSTKKSTKKAKATKAPATALTASTSLQPQAHIHPLVLAGVAILAVGYGVYEYRQDLANRLYQFRADRAARRRARS